MKILKKFFKNSAYIATTLVFSVIFVSTASLTNSNFIINKKFMNNENLRDVEVAETNIYRKEIEISKMGADLQDFEQSFLLSNAKYIVGSNPSIQIYDIAKNYDIQWQLNGSPGTGGIASRINFSSQGNFNNSVNLDGISRWSNSPELGNDLSEKKNSFFIQQANAKPNIDETNNSISYSDLINSANNGYAYNKTTITAPPFRNDEQIFPGGALGPNYYYLFSRDANVVTTTNFSMNFSPLLINFGIKVDRMVPDTNPPVESIHNYTPYIRSYLESQNGSAVLSATQDGAFNRNAINYGMFSDPIENFSFYSGIFDAIPNDVNTKFNSKKFAQYIIAARTNVSNFQVKFSADNNKLPSQKLNEIENSSSFFNINNFGITATNAIPSTFYGSKLIIEANDNNGTMKYQFVPGIGANVEKMPYSNDANVFSFDEPITNNLFPVTQNNWKRVQETTVINNYKLSDDDALKKDAVYAQIVVDYLNEYENSLKELIKEKMMFGNVPPTFIFNQDIRIEKLNYSNKDGELTFNLYLKNFYEQQQVSTVEKDFGLITISGFNTITTATEIVKSEISIQEQNVIMSEWLKQPNISDKIIELIRSTNAIINLPNDAQIRIDSSINKEHHPPKAIVFIESTKIYKFDNNKNDYYIDFSNDKDNFLPLGEIKIGGFEEIWPTEIKISGNDLNNNQLIYPSQFTENDAIELVYKNIKNTPNGFKKENIIISDLIKNNTAGEVEIDVKLNYYYDNNLNLVTTDNNYLVNTFNIKNFKLALNPTTFQSTYSSPSWSQLTPYEFSDENVLNVIRNECFFNLLQESKITMLNIEKNNLKGEIIVEGSVDKYFDDASNYMDVELGDKPLTFTIKLINFLKASLTTVPINILNVSLPQISPLNIQESILKNKLREVINFKPLGFSTENILFQNEDGSSAYVANNTKGSVVVNLGLNLWYDEKGFVQNRFKNYGQFTFIGLKTTTETIVPTVGWENSGVGYIASEVAKNKLELITIINSRIQGTKPDNWNASEDIIICDRNGDPVSDITYDNKQGTIDIYLKLKRFYDVDGILHTQWTNAPLHITIGGFKKLTPTEVVKEYHVPNVDNELATEYTNTDKIKNLINDHKLKIFSHLPNNFHVNNDMVIEFDKNIQPNPNNLKGTMNLNYEITNYYNAEGIQETNPNRSLKGKLLLSGFKQIKQTTVNKNIKIDGYQDVVASTLTKNEISDIVKNNIHLFFNNSPPGEGVKVQNVNITNNELNLTGSIEIEVTYSNFYDVNGNLISTPIVEDKVLITGFKKVQKTTFFGNIVLPTKSPYFPNELSPSIITKLLNDPSILPLFLKNYPSDFSERDILDVNIVNRNNLEGTILIDLKIVNYFDQKGNIQYVEPWSLDKILISNFSSNKPTQYSNHLEVEANDSIANELASEVSNLKLHNYVFKNIDKITTGLPTNFIELNLRNVVVVRTNNLLGEMFVNITINNFIDKDGILQTTQVYTWQVKITGFRTISPTTNVKDVYLNNVSTAKASDVDNTGLINIIMRNKNNIFSSLPENFNEKNIIVHKLEPNDSKGILKASISITSYYDKDGSLQNANKPYETTITFYNFAQVKPTEMVEKYEMKYVENYVASEFRVNKLKELIFFNLKDIISPLPENFSYNDIKNIEIISTNNGNGSLVAKISITNFFNPSNGLVDTRNTLTSEVLFTGFKSISETRPKDEFAIKVSSNVTASEFNEEVIRDYINKYYDQIFEPLPSNFTTNNIVAISNVKPDNINGKINLDVTLDLYFDENIQLANTPKSFNFNLIGFNPVQPTTFIDTIKLDDISNISAYSLSSQEIVDLIFRNKDSFIKNHGPNFSISNINFDQINGINNTNGILDVSVNYTNYYDSTGQLILDKSITKKHSIEGFAKNSKITTLKEKEFLVKGYGDVFPQELALNSDKIKEIIYQNINLIFDGVPGDIQYNELSINNIVHNNKDGNIALTILLTKYYDKNSALINDPSNPISFDILLQGFNRVDPTVQKINEITIPQYDDILASSSIDVHTIRKFVWGKKDEIFESLPSDITLKDINIEISSIDNTKGEITIFIILSKWYSANSDLQNNSSQPFKLVINGFSKIEPTRVNTQINISFPSNITSSSYYAETISINDIKTLIIYNKELFFNYIPDDFNYLNIQSIQVINRDNVDGKIRIRFSFFNYFNEHGNIEKNNSVTSPEIEITGFFKVRPTVISSGISVANECYDNLPSDYTSATLFNELSQIITSKKQEIFNSTIPFDATITLLSIDSTNNLDGTASISISTNKFYDENGRLINKAANYNLKLFGFKSITYSSTIAGQVFSNDDTDISLNIKQLNSTYQNYFANITPSNIGLSPSSFIDILESALNSPEILVQNGLNSSNYELIKISNLTYIQNSANDVTGSLKVMANVVNYWDNISGKFNDTPLPIVIEISGFKNTLYSEISPVKIIVLVIIIVAALIVCLLVALFIAKSPTIFKKKV